MKKRLIFALVTMTLFFMAACGGNSKKSNDNDNSQTTEEKTTASSEEGEHPYDPHRGEGKFDKDFDPGAIEADRAAEGKSIYNSTCIGCHKLTDERLVGPGWKGVTDKHSAAWILNFLTNTDEMLDKDPELQEQLEICMVRMPNQNLTDDEAKSIYDFMRKNDGK